MARNHHLTPEEAINKLRKFRNHHIVSRGQVKKVSLNQDSLLDGTMFIALLIQLVLSIGLAILAQYVFIPYLIETHQFSFPVLFSHFAILAASSNFLENYLLAFLLGFQFALPLTLLFMAWPALKLFFHGLIKRRLPSRSLLQKFSSGHQCISFFTTGLIITLLLEHEITHRFFLHLFPNDQFYYAPPVTVVDVVKFFAIWMLLSMFLTVIAYKVLPRHDKPKATRSLFKASTGNFSLYLGDSTGKLVERGHEAGISPKQHVTLSEKDAALNFLILGGIGEGKTTAIIHALLIQLLDQDCGGLIFDVKGSFHKTVESLAAHVGKEVVMVGPNRQQINLIAGLNPETASSMMAAIFLMTNGNKDSAFWVGQAANLCRGALGFLSFIPEHYNLVGMQKFIFNEEFKEDIECKISELELNDHQKSLLQGYSSSLMMFEDTNDKMKSDIRAAASSALSHFTHPDIEQSFCSHTDNELHLEQILDGKIFLLDTPKAIYGQASRVIHGLIKMRFFHMMDMRRVDESLNQDRMAFFMCDEYQSLMTVDPTGSSSNDMNFWDKSRDTKTIGIISAQGISSFYSGVGNRDYTKTVLQNFRQKFCFKTEDDETLRYLQNLTGRVRVGQITKTTSKGNSRSSESNHSSTTTSRSLSYFDRDVVDAQLMRNLKANQVVALLNLGQESMDDVLDLKPIYLDTSKKE